MLLSALSGVHWSDSRLFGVYASGASLLGLALHAFDRSRVHPKASPETRRLNSISAWKFLRFLVVAILLGLNTGTTIAKESVSVFDILLCVTIGYATVLSLLSVFPSQDARTQSTHSTFVLLAILVPFAYRDVWPLLTYTLQPADQEEGSLLWWKIGLLVVAAIGLPVLEPYPRLTQEKPRTPNPEETASILSTILYFFMDTVIWKAQRVKHLSAEELPDLCEADKTAILAMQAREHLDPVTQKRRRVNLLWGLLGIFRGTLGLQVAILCVNSLASFMSPVGVNRLLHYLETGGEGAVVRPWVWIAFVSGGPFLAWLLHHLFRFFASATFVRVSSIITSLVFEQALRVRLVPGNAEKTRPVPVPLNVDATGVDPEALDAVLLAESMVSEPATTVEPGGAAKENETPEKSASSLQGKINNLVTSDLANIMSGEETLAVCVTVPLNITFAVTLLYIFLGWSSFVGLAVMALLFPVPTWLGALMGKFQAKQMAAADVRVQAITETLGVLRMIKLFALEKKVQKDMADKRDAELKYIVWGKMLQLLNNLLNHTIPLIHMMVTFAIYTLVMKRELTASIVFSSITAFDHLRLHIFIAFETIPQLIKAKVSLNRVEGFLNDSDLMDKFSSPLDETVFNLVPGQDSHSIGFGPGTFVWSPFSYGGSGVTTPRQTFSLHINEELIFKPDMLNLVVGPTGAGKTSLLHALLGEMHHIRTAPNSWLNLPRDHGVAYAPQESWVLSETVKENIVFGSAYDEERYRKVLYQCALEQDLSLWQAGDKTEVGEKGVTLSGGQKARISLARAVYSSASIVLLDDVLAALDVHTSKWIVEKCLKGDLLRGRTVILVTHNLALTKSIASFVVSLNDGRIQNQGSAAEVLSIDFSFAEEMEKEEEEIKSRPKTEDESIMTNTSDDAEGKLVLVEEKNEGRISFTSLRLFLDQVGGPLPVVFWALYLLGTIASTSALTLESWWLGVWANRYSVEASSEVDVTYYLLVYAAIVGVSLVTHAVSVSLWTYGSIRASRIIHARLLSSILSSTFRWLDKTPVSRIIARCTQDIQSFDSTIPMSVNWFLDAVIGLGLKIAFIVTFAPIFLLFGLIITAIGVLVGNIYMKAQVSVKRELAVAKAPVIHVLGGAMSGLVSVRAYGCQDMFRHQLVVRNDRYVACARTYKNLNRWVGTRMSFIGSVFTTSLATYLVYSKNRPNPSNVGFLINTAAMLSEYILWTVQVWNTLEVEGNSLERLQEYLTIDHEPEPTEGGIPPAYWPVSGDLSVEKLSARYSSDGPEVLKDISFTIRSGERIGIVGRTGSGKSSLTLALLRAIPTTGEIRYDGLETSHMNLDALRSNISVIPQAPELLVGSLRQNLDPYGQHDDKTLNDALRAAGLNNLQVAEGEGDSNITLDMDITAGGSNLSLGQRQIVALARAMVRESKILILDEATSAIDYDTDAAIQRSLRNELGNDVTVLVVAHRLQSVMDADRIMVLDAGRMVEFASPAELLRHGDGLFSKLVDGSADKETLRAMARAGRSRL